jgi:hypothetical protein
LGGLLLELFVAGINIIIITKSVISWNYGASVLQVKPYAVVQNWGFPSRRVSDGRIQSSVMVGCHIRRKRLRNFSSPIKNLAWNTSFPWTTSVSIS